MKAAVDRQSNLNYKNEAMINYIIMKPLLPSENNNCSTYTWIRLFYSYEQSC